MKSKSKVFSDSRSINTIDAIRIDWNTAIKEATDYVSKIESIKPIPPFDKHLLSYTILIKIKTMYMADNIGGYLEIIDKYRDILKNN